MRTLRKTAPILGAFVVLLLLFASFQGCGSMDDPWKDKGGPPRVVVSFPTLACFTQNVAGDRAAIICLCTITGPHDYQFNARDCYLLKEANVFFANGLGLDEKFTDRMQGSTSNKKLLYSKLAEAVPKDKRLKASVHIDADGVKHFHGPEDPHTWLGIDTAKIMVERIRDDLIQVDPQGEAVYRKNAGDYLKKLDELHEYGLKNLAESKVPIVSHHEALAYFTESFKLNRAGAIQSAPGVEPAPAELRNLAEKCKGQPKVVIATEPQFPPGAAEVLRRTLVEQLKVGSVVLVEVDTLETVNDRADLKPEWYYDRMKANIDKLAEALK